MMTRIIVTNDDGVTAPGILALATALRQIAEVAVIGPALNQSASGHKKTLFQDIPVSKVKLADDSEAFSVGGSPADCIALAALGMSDWRIMVKHILPNAMVTTLTFLPFTLSGSVTILTSLDFLGLGLPPGSPSLGEMLNQGKDNLQAPWLGITGFVVTSTMLILLFFIGEAIRNAFDPRKIAK